MIFSPAPMLSSVLNSQAAQRKKEDGTRAEK